jgi:BatD DUF11 like domain
MRSTYPIARRAALALLGSLGLLAAALAQSGRGPQVKAYLTTGVARLGERVTLVISVENARDARVLAIPEVAGLELGPLSGRDEHRRVQMVNGHTTVSQEFTWSLPIRPSAEGEYQIPPIEVEADGTVLRTPAAKLTVAADLEGEELGWFEIRASSQRVVEGEPFSLELVFGWDLQLDNRINSAALSLPWWDALPGVLPLDAQAERPGVRQQTLGLNGNQRITVEEIEPQTVRGRPFRSFRLLRSFVPTRSGTLEFPTSFLEFGHVQERGFFAQRATQTESFFVRAAAFTLEVAPLPEAGRPLDFGGAIGALELRASAEPRDVDAGESIKLTVDVTGKGNLEFFDAPDPSRQEAFRGFRFFGKTEEKSFERRRIVYDIAPLTSAQQEIPPLRLPVFDPAAGEYRVLETSPIPIRVRPLGGAVTLSDERDAERFERDIQDIVSEPRPARSAQRPGAATVLAALGGAPLLALAARAALRRRRDPEAPIERRRRRARAQLKRALAVAHGPKDELEALHAWLAARTREAPQAWLGRDVRDFASRGAGRWSGGGAEELAALVAELERAAYGGGASAIGSERVLAVVDRLAQEGL